MGDSEFEKQVREALGELVSRGLVVVTMCSVCGELLYQVPEARRQYLCGACRKVKRAEERARA